MAPANYISSRGGRRQRGLLIRGANEIDFRLVTPFSNCNDMSAPAGSSNNFVFRNIVARPPRLVSVRHNGALLNAAFNAFN